MEKMLILANVNYTIENLKRFMQSIIWTSFAIVTNVKVTHLPSWTMSTSCSAISEKHNISYR